MLWFQVVNVVTNKLVRVIGSGESGERFMFVALYQGVPKVVRHGSQ